jgi:hypothetical protein
VEALRAVAEAEVAEVVGKWIIMTSRTKLLLALLGITLIGVLAYFLVSQEQTQNLGLSGNENVQSEFTQEPSKTVETPKTSTDVEFTYVMEEVTPGSDLGTYPKITSHTNSETLKKINALLSEEKKSFGCLQDMTSEEIQRTFEQIGEEMPSDFYSRTYKEQEELLGFESSGRTAVLYAKNGVLSLRALKEYSCKGPYPVNLVDYSTYDIVHGERVLLETLFTNFEKNKSAILDVLANNYALQTHDKECIEFLTEGSYEYAEFFVTDKGFFISPSLPHVSQACGGDIEIPLDEIRPYLAPSSILFRL